MLQTAGMHASQCAQNVLLHPKSSLRAKEYILKRARRLLWIWKVQNSRNGTHLAKTKTDLLLTFLLKRYITSVADYNLLNKR